MRCREMGVEAKTHWHPAHYAAIQIELEEYKEKLTFESEHPLTQEPLEIDVLIIKKEQAVEIKKNIGIIFRGHNIVEFKSETDYVSISDFYKVNGYGMFYISLEKIHPLDLTLTFITRRHPTKLFKFLKDEMGCEIREAYDGIYYIQGIGTIPIQVIETKRLNEDENLWLKSLNSSIDSKTTVEKILIKYQAYAKETSYHTYLSILLEANPAIFMEVFETMSNAVLKQEMTRVFEKKGWLDEMRNEIRNEIRNKAYEERNIILALQMIADQVSEDKIIKYTTLSREKILELKAQLENN